MRLAINGFGRIGRQALKQAWTRRGITVVAVNDLGEPAALGSALAHDSVYGAWPHRVSAKKGALVIDGKNVLILNERDPSALPWKALKIDVVLECTGRFTKMVDAERHLKAGAKRVIISAPSEDTPTMLIGMPLQKGGKHPIVNNASCTTNSVAPVLRVLEETFGVKKAFLTTIHSATAEQNLVDGLPPPLKPDPRRARAALDNIIPAKTGAAKAVARVLPGLQDRFDGLAVRVPTLDVSLSSLTVLLSKKTTAEAVNKIFKNAAGSKQWKGILGVSEEELVSSDFIGNTHSAIVDLPLTRVVDGDLLSLMVWYDNEAGYAARLVDVAAYVGRA